MANFYVRNGDGHLSVLHADLVAPAGYHLASESDREVLRRVRDRRLLLLDNGRIREKTIDELAADGVDPVGEAKQKRIEEIKEATKEGIRAGVPFPWAPEYTCSLSEAAQRRWTGAKLQALEHKLAPLLPIACSTADDRHTVLLETEDQVFALYDVIMAGVGYWVGGDAALVKIVNEHTTEAAVKAVSDTRSRAGMLLFLEGLST